ncbi:MAG: MATE family efflux transporter [Lachnospiraceae bacterium]|nr:MATE family efflux transporter [Lachnospiraceae bacterium]
MERFRDKYFGNKAFYRRIVLMMLPIMIQNAITNFVGMLDNIMVGRLGTLEMSGVSIINTLVSVYNSCIFGAVSGVGIFTVEYYGEGNEEGVRNSFRFKLLFALTLVVLAIIVFLTAGDSLIVLYLEGKGNPADAAQILQFGKQYLNISLIGLVPHALTQAYSSTLRECNKVMPPMAAGLTAMAVKLVLNYLLIFGSLGMPRLGVAGAAVSVVISRFVELAVVAVWVRRNSNEVRSMTAVFRSLRIPRTLRADMIRKSIPLMLNETLFAGGLAFLVQCYTTRDLNVVAAISISNTFYNLLSVTFRATGTAIGIMIGQLLGIRAFERAKKEALKMIVFAVMIGAAVGLVYIGIAFAAPKLYNITAEVQYIARNLLLVQALFMPVNAALNSAYYVVRAGGDTLLTMFLDCGLLFLFQAVPDFLLSRFTGIRIIPLYFCVQCGLILKLAVNLYFVRKNGWVHTLVTENSED